MSEQPDTNYKIVALVFAASDRARAVSAELKSGAPNTGQKMIARAVLEVDAHGKSSLHGPTHAIQGAGIGAVAGGLLGLLGGPAGVLALAAAGAVVGGMAGKADGVIPKAGVELLAAKMRPASSALLFLVEETHIDALTAALAEYQAEVVTIALGDEISNEIHHATALPGQVAKQTESGELLEAQPLPGQVRHQPHTK